MVITASGSRNARSPIRAYWSRSLTVEVHLRYLRHMPNSDTYVSTPAGSNCRAELQARSHLIQDSSDDVELQKVFRWLELKPLELALSSAVKGAIDYVLDGRRTGRFDLFGPDVDADERRTIGTHLQYRILANLDLIKEGPLDTIIDGVAVELKTTVGSSWMIPREGQCAICLLVQIDASRDRFQVQLIRAHRQLLNAGNGDNKRTIRAAALRQFGLAVLPWTSLPRNPLKDLTVDQRAVVFDPRAGLTKRLVALFTFLPNIAIPYGAFDAVCANSRDSARRFREVDDELLTHHGLRLVCTSGRIGREEVRANGFDVPPGMWFTYRPDPAAVERGFDSGTLYQLYGRKKTSFASWSH